MKITEFAITKKTVSYMFCLLLIVGGIFAYQNVGKLEFPTFTIKTAVVITPYPGASAEEVEQEVTDLLERSIQQMSQVKKVRSRSQSGLSIIYVDLKEEYISSEIPQIWDELRRKITDNSIRLPMGAGPAMVNDDFGDEYGVFFAITGEGYSYQDLKDYADLLKRELLLVQNVASVEIWGEQQEVINFEISRERMSELGISMNEIVNTLNSQNQVVDAGRVKVGSEYIRFSPTGEFKKISNMGDLLVRSDQQGNMVYLKDVVSINRDYQDPADRFMRFDGNPALGIGISTIDGGNVVVMGEAVKKKIEELDIQTPAGIELSTIAYQSDTVQESVDAFFINLVEAVLIVIVILCITMGFTSGLLMGLILLLTIFGTFIVMQIMGINLQLISLGALILALGMLVDNAIVITEGILIRVNKGMERKEAALETVSQTAWPLLGATFVAILAFAAIGTSKDTTGEFLGSLFQVMTISLSLSWIFAVTLMPLLCIRFLKNRDESMYHDPYKNRFYRGYKWFLDLCLNHRKVTTLILLGALGLSLWGFGFVEQSFFPKSSRPQFMIDYWRSENTHIEQTSEDLRQLENYLSGLSDVSHTTTFVGQGALRFLLTYEAEMPNTGYGQILVTVKDYQRINALLPEIRAYMNENFPEAEILLSKFALGPGGGSKIEARFVGPDTDVLQNLSQQARVIMNHDLLATEIRDDWRQQVMVIRPEVIEAKARRLGITRPSISDALAMTYSGVTIGVYRENNKLLPMVLRAPVEDRKSIEQINDIVVFSPATGSSVPLLQVVSGMETSWENPIIHRKNRKRTITVKCNPLSGNASALFERLKPQIESIKLPPGYSLEWGGEYESSGDAQASLFKMIPVFLILMVFTILMLFNAVRQTLIIFLCLPLSIIGVTAGLLISGEPFGFMCLLGFIGLSGMLIKNAVVLLDQIDLEISEGKHPRNAILDSSVSRLRPVMMAALTTVLGMIPLITDPFYSGMSITIISGLTFGTLLTLVFVPVLYAMFFRVRHISEKNTAITPQHKTGVLQEDVSVFN